MIDHCSSLDDTFKIERIRSKTYDRELDIKFLYLETHKLELSSQILPVTILGIL